MLREKQSLFDEIVDEIAAQSALAGEPSLDLRAALSGDELFGLFGLEARGV